MLEVWNSEPNHLPSTYASGHHIHHQPTATTKQSIAHMATAGIQPRQILSSLRLEAPDTLLSARDLYNVRVSIRQDNLSSKTPIQALLEALLDVNSQWTVAFKLHPSTNQVRHLFFAHARSVSFVKDFLEVPLLDCTYKMNRFKMPLLVMVGISYLNTTFYLGFAFLAEEKEEDYKWALEQVREIYSDFTISRPEMVVIDRDTTLLNALDSIFPESSTILCSWHINKNVLAKVNTFFPQEEERTAFMVGWGKLLNTETEAEYEEQWRILKRTHNRRYKDLITYID